MTGTASNYLTPLEKKAAEFMRKRGVEQATIDKFQLVLSAMSTMPGDVRDANNIIKEWRAEVEQSFSRCFALTQVAVIPPPLIESLHQLQRDITLQSTPRLFDTEVEDSVHDVRTGRGASA